MGSTLILTLLVIHILLPILSQHHIQPIVSACNKGGKLKDHQQLTFEFFSRIFVLISLLSLLPSSLRDRFQNFVKLFDHKNVKTLSPSLQYVTPLCLTLHHKAFHFILNHCCCETETFMYIKTFSAQKLI